MHINSLLLNKSRFNYKNKAKQNFMQNFENLLNIDNIKIN